MAAPDAVPSPLEDARLSLRLTYEAVWIRYFAVGGNGSLEDVRRWLGGDAPVTDGDHDLLTHALNEEFSTRGEDHPLVYRRTA